MERKKIKRKQNINNKLARGLMPLHSSECKEVFFNSRDETASELSFGL